MTGPFAIKPEHVKLFDQWLRERGGLAMWPSVNLSNLGQSWTTPRLQDNGDPATKPNWQAAHEPNRIITDPAEVVVEVPALFKRSHIAIRRSSNGLSTKLTDASARRLDRMLAQAKDKYGSVWYEFDYSAQDVVVYYAAETVPLVEWLARQDPAQAGIPEKLG